ncbi:MAG: hypothetical protein R8M14_00685 [Ghiorsea sp.]
MNLYHAIFTGAVAGCCFAFAVCMIKDLSFIDTAYRMFILGFGGAWVGFLLSWLNLILPKNNQQPNRRQNQQEHRT